MTVLQAIIQATTTNDDLDTILKSVTEQLKTALGAVQVALMTRNGQAFTVKVSAPEAATERTQFAVNYMVDYVGEPFSRDDVLVVPVDAQCALAVITDEPLSAEQNDLLQAVAGVLLHLIDRDRARSYMHSLSAFTGRMIHTLRAPLSHIVGWSSFMLDIDDDEEPGPHTRYLDIIYHSANHLDDMLEQFRTIIKLDADKMPLQWTTVNLSEAVRSVAEELEDEMRRKQQKLVRQIEPNVPVVRGDVVQLEQLVRILLDNAHKYTLEGGTITVTTRADADYVTCTVTDDGIGIRNIDQQQLFEPFYRTANEHVLDQRGTGLNLYIARRLADLHDGTLSFSSKAGQGSTFVLALPVLKPNGVAKD